VTERKVIDVDQSADLTRLVDVVRTAEGVTVLRSHGEDVAVIRPLKRARRRRQSSRDAEAVEAFRAAAGGWKDLVDTDQLIEDIYADRALETREPSTR
jgi:hypothetical protein